MYLLAQEIITEKLSSSCWTWFSLGFIVLGVLQAFMGESLLNARLVDDLPIKRIVVTRSYAAALVASFTLAAGLLNGSVLLMLWALTVALASLDATRVVLHLSGASKVAILMTTVVTVAFLATRHTGVERQLTITVIAAVAGALAGNLALGAQGIAATICAVTSRDDRVAAGIAGDYLLSVGFGLGVTFLAGLLIGANAGVELRAYQTLLAPAGMLAYASRFLIYKNAQRGSHISARRMASGPLIVLASTPLLLAILWTTQWRQQWVLENVVVFTIMVVQAMAAFAAVIYSLELRVRGTVNVIIKTRLVVFFIGLVIVTAAFLISRSTVAAASGLALTSLTSAVVWRRALETETP